MRSSSAQCWSGLAVIGIFDHYLWTLAPGRLMLGFVLGLVGRTDLPVTNKIAVNGRCFTRRITGVERYAHEISKRMKPSPHIITPGKSLGQISGHLWEQFILPAQITKR